MWSIFEQGSGKGVGLGIDAFFQRFDSICSEHVKEKRAKAFAFILYDFTDDEFRKVIKDEGVFVQLDRLAGKNLSVFYLHAGRKETIDTINKFFISKLELTEIAASPCVIFFRFKDKKVEDIRISYLDSADLIHGFHELYAVIEKYIKNELRNESFYGKGLSVLSSGTKLIGVEAFRAALKVGMEKVF